ncbi:MAG: hypothetical protein GXO36_03905 [Chloroflexi bacterium]|nr:hypothetical protein [Chloroflexota bacterium]
MPSLRSWFSRVRRWIQGFLYGMLFYDVERAFRRQHADLEDLFMLIVFGDLIGLPILPPYYSLRLLPYIVPVINRWKRRTLRERDLTDLAADLDG